MKTYRPSPMDGATLGVTIFVLGLLLFLAIITPISSGHVPSAMMVGFLTLIVAISWQAKASRYEIRDGSIVIVRGWPFMDIVIPLSEVREVRSFKFTLSTLRTFGIGGLFSSTGFFWNKETGSFFASVTNLKRAVLIEAKRKFVISPDEPDQFIADIRAE